MRRIALLGLFLGLGVACRAQLPAAPPSAPVTLDAAQLFDYDKPLPLLADEQPGQAGQPGQTYTLTKVSYYSTNNQTVPAVLVLPAGHANEKLPCVILMHGLGQNKTALTPLWPSFIK